MIELGRPRYYYESLDSTMDALNALARDGAPEGSLVVAAEQVAGRGRAGRAWRAPRGSALLCSVLLRPPLTPRELGALPLIAGLAIAEAIESLAPVRAQLKWPNDIFLGDRKICGVLMLARAAGERTEYVNLGIGINVSTPLDDLPEGATSLKAASGREIHVDDVERAVIDRLATHYERYLVQAGRPSLADWLRRAMFLGEDVEIMQDGGTQRGVFTGVTGDGALLLTIEGSERVIVAGDLTRGPRLISAE
jgi:BirA family biotin operon repressor/biotin-[acetyl-CoA-carboxylase] ligase